MRKSLILISAVALIMLTGIKWVKLTPEGEKIRVLEPNEVTKCKKLGSTSASLKDRVGPFGRSEKKVKRELEYLARNSAGEHFKEGGADTVVAVSEIDDGKQKFDVYKCVP
ncbi:MAG: DUF4156 domain-containing protein [Acidiferrobacterales bacterium]